MQVDLNLLIALDALIEHESVQGAAAALHLTPPAMSHALRRLRLATGDDVLVRNGRTMVPTPRALELQDEVRDVVSRARFVLTPSSMLDLSALTRSFTVRGNDALVAALAPPLLHEVAATAPGVSISFLGEQVVDGPDLARGIADVVIGGERPVSPSIRSTTVGEDHLVVIMGSGHPLAHRDTITLAQFAAAAHVVVSRRGRLHGAIDEVLAAQSMQRRVVASLPTAAIALAVVRTTDAIAVVADHLAPHDESLVRRPLPFELPPLEAVISWHRRYEGDPAHTWLRELITATLARLLS